MSDPFKSSVPDPESEPSMVDKVEKILARLAPGDNSVRDELIQLTYDRLQELTRKFLWKYPAVRRWEETGDVLHDALIRLMQAFSSVKIESARHYFNLSAQLIRRELLDSKRHYYGAEGTGYNHATKIQGSGSEDGQSIPDRVGSDTLEPEGLAMWTEFHKAVERLPEEQREVTGLLWYQDLSHDEAANLLGVATKTVARRWREARMTLGKWMTI